MSATQGEKSGPGPARAPGAPGFSAAAGKSRTAAAGARQRAHWGPQASHYDVLGLTFGASDADVRKAYREAARWLHPDKGGCAQAFARLQAAWETLRDPARRAAYDACAHDYRHQYVGPQERQRSSGGEAALLAELAAAARRAAAAAAACAAGDEGAGSGSGAVVAGCQLVVTCELCGRPATRACSLCGLDFCSFCARRQHWRGVHGLHWPVVLAAGSLAEALGRRELEAKRLEDDARLLSADPHHRTEAQLRELRAFNQAAALAAARPGREASRHDLEVQAELQGPGGGVLRVGVAGGGTAAAPVVVRALAGPLDPSAPLEVHRTGDGRFAVLVLTKALLAPHHASYPQPAMSPAVASVEETAPADSGIASLAAPPPPPPPEDWPWASGGGGGGGGVGSSHQQQQLSPWACCQWWRRLFVGDSDGARCCLPPPYTLHQAAEDEASAGPTLSAAYVVLELPLPWWVAAEDVQVQLLAAGQGEAEAEAAGGGDTPPPSGAPGLRLAVRGLGLDIHRTYWPGARRYGGSGSGGADNDNGRAPSHGPVVVAAASSWCLLPEEDRRTDAAVGAGEGAEAGAVAVAVAVAGAAVSAAPGAAGAGGTRGLRRGRRRRQLLVVTLARPPPTPEELLYKKGVRQDNRQAPGPGGGLGGCGGRRGERFFVEDCDPLGLSPLLQAASFLTAGGAWVVPPPWQPEQPLAGRWVTREHELPEPARQHLGRMRAAAAAAAAAAHSPPPH
ncbi:hypothetical protein HYH02_014273 [Chlamydomonas schloesseri]|uniref:J domain-containing protein n=1 Tax=Chlamydomonas schloesseri TaxID=2026947 RepID=A0A835VTM6_9CHLO|nr:hypothetical protein HYH02_014273 [Chlamydomonas schloesseri]|eukprot:KAG2428862.1 hypothetical protein HYH02_014273 [Chlamydomonas schloesseri]